MSHTMIAILALMVDLSPAQPPPQPEVIEMVSSYYGPGFDGNTTASGKIFNRRDPKMAAHKTLPFGTTILLRNPQTERTQIVKIYDRGPYEKGRHLDVSEEASKVLGFWDKYPKGVIDPETKTGVTTLEARIIYQPEPDP